jgi:hypothetical protein
MPNHENGDDLNRFKQSTNRERCIELINSHSFGLLKDSIQEFYNAPIGEIVHNPDPYKPPLGARGTSPRQDALLKARYNADICAQVQGYTSGTAGYLASHSIIHKAHKSLRITRENIPLPFSRLQVNDDTQENPYWEMRNQLFDHEGQSVKNIYGVNFAARAATGDIKLVLESQDEYSAELSDEVAKQLIRNTFILNRFSRGA